MKKIINKSKLICFSVLIYILNASFASAAILSLPGPGEIFVEKILTGLFLIILVGIILFLFFVLNFVYFKIKNKKGDSVKIEKRISLFLKISIFILLLYFLISFFRYDLAQMYEAIC